MGTAEMEERLLDLSTLGVDILGRVLIITAIARAVRI